MIYSEDGALIVDKACEDFQNRVKTMNSDSKSMDDFVKQVTDQSAVLILRTTEPAYIATTIAMSKIRKLFPNATTEQSELINGLDQSLPGNVTVAMGHDLFLLSQQLGPDVSFVSAPSSLHIILGHPCPKIHSARAT